MAEDKGLVVNIVLVGSNPMPCYVQAAYLMDGNRKEREIFPVPDIHFFVHTEVTQPYAVSIKNMLIEKYGLKIKEDNLVGIEIEDETKQSAIQEKIISIFSNEIPKGKSIYKVILNNTGGTKAMTTYATIAVREWCREKSTSLIESYLDDGTKKLNCVRLENGENGWGLQGYASYPEEKNLSYFVHLSVAEIGTLYGYKCTDKNGILQVRPFGNVSTDRKDFENALKVIAERMSANEDFMEKYLKLFARLAYIKNFKNIATEICTVEKDFSYKISKEACSSENILKLFDAEEEKGWFYYDDKLGLVASTPDGECWTNLFRTMALLPKKKTKKTNNLQEYLTMYRKEWFEEYVYMVVRDTIEEKKQECDGDMPEVDLLWSLTAKESSSEDAKDFELDIVMSVGYELKVLSLTIDNNSLMAEHKFFEAVFRGEMLGGTHSQIIAVNWTENGDKLEKQLSSFSGEQYHHIEIWGKEVLDYKTLKKKVKKLLRTEMIEDCGEKEI